jgi:hypothetical protein
MTAGPFGLSRPLRHRQHLLGAKRTTRLASSGLPALPLYSFAGSPFACFGLCVSISLHRRRAWQGRAAVAGSVIQGVLEYRATRTKRVKGGQGGQDLRIRPHPLMRYSELDLRLQQGVSITPSPLFFILTLSG